MNATYPDNFLTYIPSVEELQNTVEDPYKLDGNTYLGSLDQCLFHYIGSPATLCVKPTTN